MVCGCGAPEGGLTLFFCCYHKFFLWGAWTSLFLSKTNEQVSKEKERERQKGKKGEKEAFSSYLVFLAYLLKVETITMMLGYVCI